MTILEINLNNWESYPYSLILILLTFFVIFFKFFKFRSILKKISSPKFHAQLLKNGSYSRFLLKHALLLIGFIFLLIALLQPQWGEKSEMIEQEGRDLLIALDISRSMLAPDKSPNRFEFAKNKIRSLVKNLSCERVGLLLFSGNALLQCPLTVDEVAFERFLNLVSTEEASSGTTCLDKAIKRSIELYSKMEKTKKKKTKIVAIFTDGEDFSEDLASAKKMAAKEKLSIFTFGVGTEHGAPIPILDSSGKQVGVEKDENGITEMSKMDESKLIDLSAQTGAVYISSSDRNNNDIFKLIHNVEKFEKDRLEDKDLSRLNDRYNYFAIVSFVCLALEWLL